ncbi:MAG: LamGL protein, partial [Candidatus Hydrogenedentes bacterium]|nr:LamGL protein [Candidatus Hydrogenedentota bacterium]
IHWSQPEILLYDDDPFIRMSYPDLIEEDGQYFITETQKNVGRVHAIPQPLLDGLFGQFENRSVARDGLALDLPGDQPLPQTVPMPALPEFHTRDGKQPDYRGKDMRAGFSLDFRLQLDSLAPGQTILDSRDDAGSGILVATTDTETVRITMNDGRQESCWDCDRNLLQPGQLHHVGITVDGGPKIVTFIVDGVLCDGGDLRQFGWGRFSPTLRAPNGADTLRIAPAVRSLRLYTRALRTSEMAGNYRASAGQ